MWLISNARSVYGQCHGVTFCFFIGAFLFSWSPLLVVCARLIETGNQLAFVSKVGVAVFCVLSLALILGLLCSFIVKTNRGTSFPLNKLVLDETRYIRSIIAFAFIGALACISIFLLAPDEIPLLNLNPDKRFIDPKNLSSLCEVAIGLNAALTILDSFTLYVVTKAKAKIAHLVVLNKEESDPTSKINYVGTFAEAFEEAFRSRVAQLIGESPSLESEKKKLEQISIKFKDHIQKETHLFESACDALNRISRLNGMIVAIGFFSLLTLITASQDSKLLLTLKEVLFLFFSTLVPLFMHAFAVASVRRCFVKTLYKCTFRSSSDEREANRTNSELAQDALKKYDDKLKTLATADEYIYRN
jgi:hypothetical protein